MWCSWSTADDAVRPRFLRSVAWRMESLVNVVASAHLRAANDAAAVRDRLTKGSRHRRLTLYGLDRSTPVQRRAFRDRVERRIGTLVR